MTNKRFFYLCWFLAFMQVPHFAYSQVYKDPKAGVEARVKDLLGRMTLDEKIDQLSGTGDTGFDTRENARLGIPAFKMTDGPLGVRWGKSTSFPCGVAVAATWDTSLVSRFAVAIAEETKAHGRNYLLGPCVNIHRFPAGGRNFESYGEDPWLTSRLAVSYIKALQSRNVIASVKHFALNNQEWQRTEINVLADERAMREIYLPSFEAAVKEAGVYTLMSAYNKVNGWWCSENNVLLTDILKHDWGFKGLVVSDWVSTHSTMNAANNGLDLEMPTGDVFSMANLKKAITEGKVSEETINDKVSRILRVKFKAGLFDKHFIPDTTVLTSQGHKKLALEIAEESIVLLKNQEGLLPLTPGKLKKIAVIGPNAAVCRVGGGGSSRVNPCYSISPLEGIKKLAGSGTQVVFAQGDELRSWSFIPVKADFLCPEGVKGKGLKAEFFTNDKLEGKFAFTRIDSNLYFNWEDDPPAPGIGKDNYSVRWSGTITPPETRAYTFYTASDDGVRLFIDGKQIISNWTDHGTTVDSGKIDLVSGKPYSIRVEYYENGGSAVLMMGWDLPQKKAGNAMIADAVEAARTSDVAIIFAGTSDSFESEGFDRVGGLNLPGSQDELIKAVAEANPKTIVVLNTGTPVITERWLNKVPALLEAFFPGQEGGNAVAEILFGKHNPSAKLPFSFISGYDQTPAYAHYMDKDLDAPYNESIFVGYRYLEKNKLLPTFPFGFGLSYTTFSYSGLRVEEKPGGTFLVSLKVKNTGKKEGSETVQLYVSDDHSRVPHPVKELKGFAKVSLMPGEEKTVNINLNRRSFSYFDTNLHQWKADPGNFDILAGSSSADIRLTAKLQVK
ncbi:MAG: glycoside hydrolase family 3 C-terminal domain-containing protein [Bacteroidetes bacterium]|nr:glycoside hydrolase family 3 C-terminal domain-containing protein [Bacteroidota bacterium]